LSESRIIERKEGAVGWLVFSNPAKRNAMSVNMWEAIPQALERFAADPQIRVVALTGEGDKAFVSGADISQFEAQRSGPEAVQRYEEISEGAQRLIHEFDKPTVAVVRGYCLGAGVNIALACDLRLAADDARFGIPAARMGLGYRASSLKNLVDAIGAANAREFLITARQFTAAEALHIGLVHQVVPIADFSSVGKKYLDDIASNAPLTMRSAKRIIRELLRSADSFDAAKARAWMKECYDSADYKEGRTAFMEKRQPVFRGK
jgi:enoyl-CoA hydratase/carnithine racemase